MTTPIATTPGRLAPNVEETFPKLTPAQIERVAVHGHVRRTEQGEVLGTVGKVTSQFFVVRTGAIEAVQQDENGKSTTVTTIEPGEFTGEVSMLSGRPALVTL
ncbi:MAG TPA: cyclic nucleotide-binding domain-containing protein, partial [Gemmatimonadaceae bacterium]|nr:cyclic nucleotide-binding domain-containing protein [Gemmatimonadaceae bacterium]